MRRSNGSKKKRGDNQISSGGTTVMDNSPSDDSDCLSQCSTEAPGSAVQNDWHYILLSSSKQNTYYYGFNANHQPNYETLKLLFLSCEWCNSENIPICQHAERQMAEGYNNLLQEFTSQNYGNFLASAVPECAKKTVLKNVLKSTFCSYQIKQDGNCFFASVSFAMCLDPVYGKAIRRCAYLSLSFNKILFGIIKTKCCEEFERQQFICSRDKEWASDYTFYITSAIVSRPIVVYSYNRGKTTISGTRYSAADNGNNPLYLWLNGAHFEPLIFKTAQAVAPPAIDLPDFRKPLRKADLMSYIKERRAKTIGTKKTEKPRTVTRDNSINKEELMVLEEIIYEENYDASKSTIEAHADNAISKLPIKLQIPKDNITESNKGKFTNKNDQYYVKVLRHFQVELGDFEGSNDNSPNSLISKFVNSTEPWDFYTRRQLKDKKISSTKMKQVCRAVYMKQSYKEGRELFVKMMQNVNLGDIPIRYYMNQCDEKFGQLKLSIPIPEFFKEPIRNIPCHNSEDDDSTCMEPMRSNENSMIDNFYPETPTKETVESHVHLPMETDETEDYNMSKSPNLGNSEDENSEVFYPITPTKEAGNTHVYQPMETDQTEDYNMSKSPNLGNSEDENYEVFYPKTTTKEAGKTHVNQPMGTDQTEDYTTSKSPNLGNSDNENSEAENPETLKDVSNCEDVIEANGLCEILGVTKNDLAYQPPLIFKIKLKSREVGKCFNFEQMEFIKRKWPIYIGRAFKRTKTVCSFHAKKGPDHCKKKTDKFCTMHGKCGGNCKMEFTVIIKKRPRKGKSLTCHVNSKGAFHLLQKKSTGREMRNDDRLEIQKELKHNHPNKIFLDNIQHIPGLRALHRNLDQKSKEVLRKARSEIQVAERLDPDAGKEIILLKQQFIDEDIVYNSNPKNIKIPGYIQHTNITPGNFQLLLYTRQSLIFHAAQVKSGYNVCFFDATGGVMKKISDKTPLLYALMGRNKEGVTYSIADFLSEDGTTVEIMSCLARIKRHIHDVKKTSEKLFTHVFVIDWSWPMIHGVCKGINDHDLMDYIHASWELLNGATWKQGQSCIVICASHLIAATKRLFSKKLSKSTVDQNILHVALQSLARTQECFTLQELGKTLSVIIRTFGFIEIEEEELQDNLLYLKQHKYVDAFENVNEREMGNEFDLEFTSKDIPVKQLKTIREQSPFYNFYLQIHSKELLSAPGVGWVKNPLHCPAILNAFSKYKLPLFPLWGSAIPRLAYHSTFLRETNAVVESSFNVRKNKYYTAKNQRYPEFVRNNYDYHMASLRQTGDKIIEIIASPPPKTPIDDTELRNETWKKKSSARKTIFFSTHANQQNFNNKSVKMPVFGLPNIGLTCYMNSALQMIMSLPITSIQRRNKGLEPTLSAFYDAVHNKKCNYYEALKWKTEVDVLTEYMFPPGRQHDPHEFIKRLLNLKDLEFLRKSLNIETKTSLTCNICSRVLTVCSTELELVIPPNSLVEETVRNYCQPEIILDYKCEGCEGYNTTKIGSIEETSKYLLVLTSPFKNSGKLAPGFVHEKTAILPEFHGINHKLTVTTNAGSRPYELLAFIAHEGKSIDEGHYRAYIINGSGYTCCDDEKVYQTTDFLGTLHLHIYKSLSIPSGIL